MNELMQANVHDSLIAISSNEAALKNKEARNSQWHVISIAESFKQHGHMYLAILNLAAHLSSHPIARTLTNIGKRQGNVRKSTKAKGNACKREEGDRVASIEQIQQSSMLKDRWKNLAAAAVGDVRVQGRGPGAVTDGSYSSDHAGRVTDSVSLELQQKFTGGVGQGDDPLRVLGGVSAKQSKLNRVAATKLNFIEQILNDLTLIKDEIEFATDPIHYNEPGYSFA